MEREVLCTEKAVALREQKGVVAFRALGEACAWSLEAGEGRGRGSRLASVWQWNEGSLLGTAGGAPWAPHHRASPDDGCVLPAAKPSAHGDHQLRRREEHDSHDLLPGQAPLGAERERVGTELTDQGGHPAGCVDGIPEWTARHAGQLGEAPLRE